MGRVPVSVAAGPSVELEYPPHSPFNPNDPLGLSIVPVNSSSSPAMPILIAGVAGFAIVCFMMVIALVIRSRRLITRRSQRAAAAAASDGDDAGAHGRPRRVRTPKPMEVPVPIVVVEPDESVEIAFRLAQGPDQNAETPQRTTFPPGELPMLRTPTVRQLLGLARPESSEIQSKPEETAPGGS